MDDLDHRLVAIADQVTAAHAAAQRDRGVPLAAALGVVADDFARRYGAGSAEAAVARYYRDHLGPDLVEAN